ncbi:hypothetical protein CEXT_728261 [Caerostris extrusa]|uniref:Uncharacterized protein n=1 Tax=Caerostris extrusa TaxID=172846 RepID=A0AAV4P6P4_CAEEX|nr:hypothetical protein CEXT_728261 [Caerostris extrusa]
MNTHACVSHQRIMPDLTGGNGLCLIRIPRTYFSPFTCNETRSWSISVPKYTFGRVHGNTCPFDFLPLSWQSPRNQPGD